MCDALMTFMSVPGFLPVDADAERMLHWFFDGDPPPDLHPGELLACDLSGLMQRGGAGYDPAIMTMSGSRSSA